MKKGPNFSVRPQRNLGPTWPEARVFLLSAAHENAARSLYLGGVVHWLAVHLLFFILYPFVNRRKENLLIYNFENIADDFGEKGRRSISDVLTEK